MKKTNSRQVNQNLIRGTNVYSFLTIVDKTLSTRPGMEIAEAERKTFDELKSNYRQALISNYHDLVQMVKILKNDPIHKQMVATAKRLRSKEDNDLAESYAWVIKKRKFLLERILDNYEMPKLSTTKEVFSDFYADDAKVHTHSNSIASIECNLQNDGDEVKT